MAVRMVEATGVALCTESFGNPSDAVGHRCQPTPLSATARNPPGPLDGPARCIVLPRAVPGATMTSAP